MKFQKGDLCVVVGDADRTGHLFNGGTEVVLDAFNGTYPSRNGTTPAWIASESNGTKWWVGENDLELVHPTPTEIDEAIESIKTRVTMNTPRKHSPYFFNREPDGTVRLRIRFDSAEAALMEEAAGDTPVMVWLHRTLTAEAKRQVRAARRRRGKVEPPRDMEGSP